MKQKFNPEIIYQVDKNFTDKKSWLKFRTKVKDQKCANCGKLFIEDNYDRVGLAKIKGSPNIAICSECSDLFISFGAVDIVKKREEIKNKKESLINLILGIPNHQYKQGHTNSWNESKDLDLKKEDELQIIYDKLKKDYDNELRIKKEIEYNWKDVPLEQYLIDDYNVFENKQGLKHIDEIESYFNDCAVEYFDCGQGYYENEKNISY